MIAMQGHRARKRFGQHFLHDNAVIARIIGNFDPQPGEIIVEIGPGKGALTGALLQRVPSLHAVELDRDLVSYLHNAFPRGLSVHQADALRFDFCRFALPGRRLRLIGNLPYNISTPLLIHLLEIGPCIQDMLFMLQKEVVDRLVAEPGGKDYGRLSVMVQWRCRVERVLHVSPGAFSPPPRVESAVVRLTPHEQLPVTVDDPDGLRQIVLAAFSQRRKVLRNCLKQFLPAEAIAGLGIDPGRRPETLSLQEFAVLANAYVGRGHEDTVGRHKRDRDNKNHD
ncbi:MAG: 16S rRNA (adenine(1518)-N(6)/adenine(1519)-N(6))-dimethyltransferase RsmA [Acidiferrobacterales bacterium]